MKCSETVSIHPEIHKAVQPDNGVIKHLYGIVSKD